MRCGAAVVLLLTLCCCFLAPLLPLLLVLVLVLLPLDTGVCQPQTNIRHVIIGLILYYTNHIYIAPICGATEALDDSQSGGIKQKRFQMFL